ncbi:MutS protein msh4 [Aspergillus hancockii]|nr:MutS protein msh4 [Aspergillus hancockii]
MSILMSRTSSLGPTNSFVPLLRQSSEPLRARLATTATSVASQDIICAISESRGISSTVGLTFVPDTTITFLDRRDWSEKIGHEYVDRLAFPEDIESIKTTFGGNYFAACCFAAVLKYVELELNRTFTSHSLRIRFEPSLTGNASSKESLLGLLNETLTPVGGRLLRANILQPSTETSKLLARYDAVEDLSTKEEMFVSIRQALKGFVDADKLIFVPTKRTLQYVEQSVNNVIMLKTYVFSIRSVYKTLGTAQSSLLLTIRDLCAPAGHRTIEDLIETTINEVNEAIAMLDMLSAFAQLARCHDYARPELTDVLAIKSGRHPIREKTHPKSSSLTTPTQHSSHASKSSQAVT